MCLQLCKKVQEDNRLQIIQLPSSGNHIRENEECEVAGWGFNRTDGKNVNDLRVVGVTAISLGTCKKEWEGLSDNVICAGGYDTNKGFCQVKAANIQQFYSIIL